VCSPDLYVSPAKIIYSIISIYIRERGGFNLNNTDWGSKYITRRRRRIIRRPTKWFSPRFNNDVVIMTEVATLEDYDQGMDSRASSCAGYPHQPCRIQVTRADGEVLSMAADLSAADLSAADSAIEAASSGAVPRALRVEELLYEADKNISRSGSFSSLSGDTSGTDGDVDSRPNSGEAPLEPPSEDLIKKIVDQVEFYFSDENILKDAFLLKHVRRNKQGFVSLKLITSFKRIKSLTKDYRVVAVALRAAAEKLEVNAEGTKVKRIDPLPDYDETTTSRTVIAMRLPLEGEPTFDDVANLFKKCGEIVLIRIVKHGGVVPSDLKQYIHKHPEIGKETCSVIEFDTHAAAQRACALGLPMDDDGGGGDTGGGGAGLMVALLQPPRGKKNPLSKQGKSSGAATAGGDDDNNNPNNHKKDRKLKKKNDRLAAIAGDSPAGSSAASDSESEFLSANESDGVRNGRHSHHRQPHSNKENSPGRADRHGNWRSPAAATASPTTTTATTTMTTTIQDKGKAQRYTPGSSPTNTPKSTPKSSPQASPRMQRRSQGSQPQQQQQQQQQQNSRTNTGTDSPPTQSQPARRSGARPSPMSSPEAIRRRRSAGAIAQQQQQQGLVVGVSPLAQESAGGTRSPPSGSSPPRATGDAAVGDNSAGKPPVYPPSTATAGGDLGMSPWVQRRLQEKEKSSTAAADTSAEGAGGSNATAGTASPGRSNSPAVHRRRTDAPPRLLDSLGVVRQPRGPDGTKGFHPGAREALTWPPFAAVAAS